MWCLSIITVATVLLISVVYYWITKRITYFKSKGILCNDWKFPLGDLTGVGSKIHLVYAMQNAYEKYKGRDVLCGFYNMFLPVIFILDLDLAKDILVKDFNSFMDRGAYYNEESDPLSANLFAIEGEKWRFLRNKLSPTFTSGKMKMMYHTITAKGEDLTEAIKRNQKIGPVNAKELSRCFTSDVIGSCAFGIECNGLKNDDSDIMIMGKKVFDFRGLRLVYMLFLDSFKDIARKLGLRLFQKDVEDYFMRIIRETIQYRKENNVQRKDFMNLLIQLMEKGNIDEEVGGSDTRKITFNELAAQAFIFLFAGFETTTTLMSFMFYELAHNQDIQEKVRAEIQQVLKNHNGEITYEAVQEMTYLQKVLNETLRRYPPAGFLFRVANEDYKVRNSNHVIEKGRLVMIPAYAIHHDPKIYKNPTVFDPERFSPEEVEKRHNFSYLPFGDGNRNCIGMRFAILEVKYAFAKILNEFKLTLDHKTDTPLKLDPELTIMDVKNGIWVNFEELK